MRESIIIIFLFFATFGKINGQTQSVLLNKAYKTHSDSLLTQFFENWSKEIKTNNETITNDTIKEVYNIYKSFFQPTKLSKIGGEAFLDTFYIKKAYFLVQTVLPKIYFIDKLYYTKSEIDSITRMNMVLLSEKLPEMKPYLDTLKVINNKAIRKLGPNSEFYQKERRKLVDSIYNFYPEINYKNQKALYLTTEYYNLLEDFLKNKHVKLGKYNIMQHAYAKGKSEKRKAFLDNKISVFYGHWGGYWQLHTYPQISAITFDNNMSYAKVEYQIIYRGGEALLKKQGNNWIIIESKMTWVE